ncbi:pentatricopeptide repeat-containing protein At1g12620-like isoform X2 [Fagus crenata]
MATADEFVNQMYASGWDPDITTYNIRIHSFCSSRRMNRAVMMLDELVSAGIVPDTVTYNTMLNGVCSDILDRAMILTAKLLKMAFIPNVVTTNVVLSQFRKQGMPERTLMWCQKLSEISFDFDEITYKIMDRAYRDIEEDAKLFRGASAKSLFLDFLMYITYDVMYRNRPQRETNQNTLKLIESGFELAGAYLVLSWNWLCNLYPSSGLLELINDEGLEFVLCQVANFPAMNVTAELFLQSQLYTFYWDGDEELLTPGFGNEGLWALRVAISMGLTSILVEGNNKTCVNAISSNGEDVDWRIKDYILDPLPASFASALEEDSSFL